ncbi:helicase-related protein [Dysgonomonas capnocytophagoides]|uniref:helicase-related protein n=1 Tax=Dysgonomonas capnocytophagoides TaxID=45254 RepID=UPI0006877D83|nr:helicase-related protein [Dysgonomonas capnocytophagoides]
MKIEDNKLNSEYFITNNGEKSLAKMIKGILPVKADCLDFLVGYFYFSGIEEIYKNISDKKMRILVGLEMEKDLLNKTSEIDFLHKKQKSSRLEIRNEFNYSLVELFNKTDFFEGKKETEAFKIYYEKIKNGTLEIRKTKEPCHAKMYIFSYKDEFSEEGETPGTVITGSSNLTYKGLRGQNEINVRFQHKTEFHDAQNIFNTLWQSAIVIADKDHINDFEDGVIKHIWYEKLPSPYLLYLRVLYEYFKIDTSRRIRTPHDINKKFFNLKYQEDAIRMAISIIEKHNGVIVSDVVGLGKSIIGSTVANNLNLRTIIISPPHLKQQWEDYIDEFKINTARVFSRGVISKALEHYQTRTDENEEWLIVIDEAHNYRNEFTLDYGMLHELCRGNKVMLLTATPFNNQPSDIYSMIKLFQIPTKSTLQTVNNLGYSFRHLINVYKNLKKKQKDKQLSEDELKLEIESIAQQIRAIISPLIIRRSRLDLDAIPAYKEDLKKQKIEFSKPAPPRLLDYDLNNLRNLYISTLEQISRKGADENIDMQDYNYSDDIYDENIPLNLFHATRYKPIMYVKPEYDEEVKKTVEKAGFEYNLFKGAQRNLAKFMRTLLVRRFESSQIAFRISLDNMLSNHKNIKKWIEKRQTIPVFKKGMLPDIEAMYESTNDIIPEMVDDEIDAAIEKLQTRGLFEIKTEYLKDSFFDELDSDIEILQNLKSEWNKVNNDPKLNEFINILNEQLAKDPERKIVVFSQFADTIDYLDKKLTEAGLPVFSYTANKATPRNKEIIRANFDAGYEVYKQQDTYKILVATDAISEGYNLHRAGTIFNYDIPYNPTRVIQRIGRINRINKKMFDELYIYNYFPTDIGESEIRVQEISTLKMAMIHAIMGEDTKVLTSNEELRAFFIEQYKTIIENDERKSWDTEYRAELDTVLYSNEMREALNLPLRTKIRRRASLPEDGVLVFAKKGNDFVFKYSNDENKPYDRTPEDAFRLLKTSKEEKPYKPSETFDNTFNIIKSALFSDDSESDTEKIKRDALDKVRLMIQMKSCENEYLEDLKTAVELDAISGYALRLINRMKPSEYVALPDKISRTYILKALRTYDNISHGTETLILAEEFESDSITSKTNELF